MVWCFPPRPTPPDLAGDAESTRRECPDADETVFGYYPRPTRPASKFGTAAHGSPRATAYPGVQVMTWRLGCGTPPRNAGSEPPPTLRKRGTGTGAEYTTLARLSRDSEAAQCPRLVCLGRWPWAGESRNLPPSTMGQAKSPSAKHQARRRSSSVSPHKHHGLKRCNGGRGTVW